ncbi:EamA family transporter [Listeria booriae]|nr:EamA family transporter [Listeria booriae]
MSYISIIGMTFLGALGGLYLKKISLVGERKKKFIYFLIGGCFYGLGAILNIVALSLLPYTIVFPLSSITYIWTFLFSFLFLSERINRFKIIGLLLIITGAFCITS